MTKRKILVVGGEGPVLGALPDKLRKMGYDVPAVAGAFRPTDRLVKLHAPDLAMVAISQKYQAAGIEVALLIRNRYETPVILLPA